ncbi:MAG TPA: hypothetical protein VJH92_02625 [Candidatus Nanoarchaeia archaeon]|nr:hypothetical protein [Candidatus Nanoarchaeia archaeon]
MTKNHKPHSLDYTHVLSDGRVIHYTCNAPSMSILSRHGVMCVGNDYGCRDSREVVIIPSNLARKYGIIYPFEDNVARINAEKIMRRLK